MCTILRTLYFIVLYCFAFPSRFCNGIHTLVHPLLPLVIKSWIQSSPIEVGTEVFKFQENGECDDVKKVFFPRFNVYSFLIQNAIGLEKVSLCSLSLLLSFLLRLFFPFLSFSLFSLSLFLLLYVSLSLSFSLAPFSFLFHHFLSHLVRWESLSPSLFSLFLSLSHLLTGSLFCLSLSSSLPLSPSLFLCLPPSLSFSLSFSISPPLSFSLYSFSTPSFLFISPSLFLSFYFPLSFPLFLSPFFLNLFLFLFLSFSLSLFLSLFCLSLSTSLFLSVSFFVSLSFGVCVSLSPSLFVSYLLWLQENEIQLKYTGNYSSRKTNIQTNGLFSLASSSSLFSRRRRRVNYNHLVLICICPEKHFSCSVANAHCINSMHGEVLIAVGQLVRLIQLERIKV